MVAARWNLVRTECGPLVQKVADPCSIPNDRSEQSAISAIAKVALRFNFCFETLRKLRCGLMFLKLVADYLFCAFDFLFLINSAILYLEKHYFHFNRRIAKCRSLANRLFCYRLKPQKCGVFNVFRKFDSGN